LWNKTVSASRAERRFFTLLFLSVVFHQRAVPYAAFLKLNSNNGPSMTATTNLLPMTPMCSCAGFRQRDKAAKKRCNDLD